MERGDMARYKKYDYKQMVLLPISLEEQVVPGTLEFAIHTVVESKLNMSVFDEKFNNDETGRLAYDPKVLLKVVLFGYARGLISSRKIERACQENIIFMALSCGQKPDHSTIAMFVSSMKEEILPLFRDVLLVCEEMNLLGGTFFALDGCKLPSNASTQWSGEIEDLKRKKDKLEEKVRELIKEQEEEDGKDDGSSSDREYRDKLVEKFKKQVDRIQAWLKDNNARIGKTGREVKSNVIDNDSAKMTSSHGAVQGYNSQALVDAKHQVIVHGEVFGESQDIVLAEPVIDGARENMEQIGHTDYFKGKTFTADSGYHSKVNIQKCMDEGLDAYIPDKLFRRRDPRFAGRMKKGEHCKRTHYILEDFQYNDKEDHYICPNNKILSLNVKRMVTTGNVYRRYKASEEDCRSCSKKDKCIYGNGRGPKQLMVPIGPDGVNLTKIMIKKLESEQGKKIYSRRMAVVEPVFANIRFLKRMDRFTLRSKIKVNIQWLLYCMVHNIEKIANYGFT
jgi:transposase